MEASYADRSVAYVSGNITISFGGSAFAGAAAYAQRTVSATTTLHWLEFSDA